MNHRVAIVDYGLGNLFSVKHACGHVGLAAEITSDRKEIMGADAVILPGVGAYGDAMDALRRLDLVQPLRDLAGEGRPLVGICLGMQLVMSGSDEFGWHEGLGLVRGQVVRFEHPEEKGRELKVPQVGWNHIRRTGPAWEGTLLDGLSDGVNMYFVHSFHVKPEEDVAVCLSRYGQIEFCSGLRKDGVWAFQFHPERSGAEGLKIYRNLARWLSERKQGIS
ncbi:MAG TPA: imidazole glycerol phosphate synthase subunit HisH [Kiritimatiellia bacterium]|nr:imidazole glycerol phosphate synthase subunit HisH [Kiritimatiellia bacterium]